MPVRHSADPCICMVGSRPHFNIGILAIINQPSNVFVECESRAESKKAYLGSRGGPFISLRLPAIKRKGFDCGMVKYDHFERFSFFKVK